METPIMVPKTSNRHLFMPELILLDSAEFCTIFQINNRTALKWRQQGVVGYVKRKGRILYPLSEILKTVDKLEHINIKSAEL